MKKKGILLLTAMVLSGMTAAGAAGAQITEDEAKTIALDDAGWKEEDVSRIRTKTEKEDGRDVIEVEIITEEKEEYDYEILAEDGTILGASYEWERIPEGGAPVTLEEAKETAVTDAGETLEAVTFEKEETDRDDGRTRYELEFYTDDQKEYEYEIDADTGVIVSWDYDGERYLSRKEKG